MARKEHQKVLQPVSTLNPALDSTSCLGTSLTTCVQSSRKYEKNGSSERRRKTHNARLKTSDKGSTKPQQLLPWHLDSSLCYKSMAPSGTMVRRRVLGATQHHRVLEGILHNKSASFPHPWGTHLPDQ